MEQTGKNGSSVHHPQASPLPRPARGAASRRNGRGASSRPDQLLNILEVLQAARRGDFSVRLRFDGPDATGTNGRATEASPLMTAIANELNAVIALNQTLAEEMVRVERVVGREGRMTERASLGEMNGGWATSIGSINALIGDLVQPTTEVARVISAVAEGDFTQKMALEIEGQPVKGEFLRIGRTVNGMVAQLSSFAAEVTRVAKEVGTDGKLGGQADVPGAAGIWRDLTDNVNLLANNLTAQVRNVAEVTTAVARGDLSKKITVDAKGEVLELKSTINTMVDQLRAFASEVTRVAREVGTEGKLGGQADVKGVSGTWKDLTDNVNVLAGNLTDQVRNIAKVTTAVANGDLSQKITVDVKGEILELKNTINTMVDQLNSFAAEVTRVAREVGTDGNLGGQARVPGVSGTWKNLTDNVNLLAGNLTDQVRNIAKVTTAVANGDLSQKITVDVKGEILELKDTINTMVDQLRSFAGEVTRVAKEVGSEGKLGGQAEVQGVSGVWKDLTENVNSMASNLTAQVRNIALVTTAVATGDLSKKITVDVKGEILELKNTINTMVDQLNSFASEVTRVAKEVGTEGELGGQAEVPGVAGVWKNLTDNVNFMARNLTAQVRGIVKVVTAVANGDLKQKMVVEAKGEIAALADTINSMTDTLSTFAEQVSTVAREVGVEGKLGGQARVPGVSGTWKDLTDNVNFMASNLTTQVRGLVKVVTAVANGDLSQKLIGVEAKGEIAALADTINDMCDTLGTFAAQVSTVAREVGIEGKLGGQAKVPGAVGTWRQLTDNVNQLAGNLTAQVRAISEVTDAVTKGDLTRSIEVAAQGEVAALKDKINQMIINLRETTQKNAEQDWLKTNLAKFSSMMQGQKNLETVSRLIMSELTPLVSAHHGAFFMFDAERETPLLTLTSTYAYRERKGVGNRFRMGEGLVGQCALEKKTILLTRVPPDYIQISSGLGEAPPLNIIVLPVLFEGQVKAVIELASFHPFSPIHQLFLDQLMESIGVVLNMIGANMRTEELLEQSQSLTQELQSQSNELTLQQDELRRTNTALEKQALELEEKARLLAEQNRKVEVKNREVEQARLSLEEKAEQLSMTSKYKSEFLANMSHELRTPLNSLLILAQLLSENPGSNLTAKQVEYAKTIHASGVDLLTLINEILDLSKVEAGKMPIDPRDVAPAVAADFVERSFRAIAEQKNLAFRLELEDGLPEYIFTDPQRLQQVLKNLLANAFKFTAEGSVTLRVHRPRPNTRFSIASLNGIRVVAFAVIDTGIGIPRSKQELIFEAFQQADGTTNRRYGGTGLGLSISREIARLLGGEIQIVSEPGVGSTFTLYLPERYMGPLADPQDGAEGGRVLPEGVSALAAPGLVLPDLKGVAPLLPALAGRRILVVDDDVRNGFALTSMLEAAGLEVVYAHSGEAGIEALADHPGIDGVLMDVMMPGKDGYQTIRAIRANPAWRDKPIIAVTAKALEDDRAKCLEAGATDYLAKPVDTANLLELIHRLIDGTSRDRGSA